MTDVVVVTLRRKTLNACLKAIGDSIPNPKIILVEGKGQIGDLRNRGLNQVKSPIFAFVDDDVIINKTWFERCSEKLRTPNVAMVCGTYYPFGGLGCCLCKTDVLKKIRVPRLDTQLEKRLEESGFVVSHVNVCCEHLHYGYIRHTLYWMRRGFYHGIKSCLEGIIISLFRRKDLRMSFVYFVWLINGVIRKTTRTKPKITS